LGEIRLGEMGLGEMGLGEMGQNLYIIHRSCGEYTVGLIFLTGPIRLIGL